MYSKQSPLRNHFLTGHEKLPSTTRDTRIWNTYWSWLKPVFPRTPKGLVLRMSWR